MTLFGVAVTARAGRTETQEADFLADVLGRRIDLQYTFSGLNEFPARFSVAPFRHIVGRAPMWSFKMDPLEAIGQEPGGTWSQFVASVPAHPLGWDYRFIYYQEPGNQGRVAPDLYRAAFHRLQELTGRDDILFGVNLSSWDFDPRNPTAQGPRYIPATADFVGLSLFTSSKDPGDNKDALGRAYEAVHDAGVPFGLSSIGVSWEQTRTAAEMWMRHLADFAHSRAAYGDPLDHIVCYSSDISPWEINEWWLDGADWTTRAWRDLIDTARGG